MKTDFIFRAIYDIGRKINPSLRLMTLRPFSSLDTIDSMKFMLPIYLDADKVFVFFSPKAGCTSVVNWCYQNLGILEKVQTFYEENKTLWPHHYRVDAYYPEFYGSDWQKTGIATLKRHLSAPENLRIKVVRNPYERIISSYLAFSNNGDGIINRRNLDLSFREFLEYLYHRFNTDPHLNIHLRRQILQEEKDTPGFFHEIIKLEEFNRRIEEINLKHNISLKPMERSSFGHHYRYEGQAVSFAGETKFSALKDRIPAKHNFYNNKIERMVFEIYREDILAYQYEYPYQH